MEKIKLNCLQLRFKFSGYNEFCEYAKMYYNLEYEISSVLAKEIGEENTLLKIKTENEKRKRKEQEKPLNITVTNTTSPLAYQVR